MRMYGGLAVQFLTLNYVFLLSDSMPRKQMEFVIRHTWDSDPLTHEPIRFVFSPGDGGLKMKVFAPYFNDPEAPPGTPGQPFPGLWDYEGMDSTWSYYSPGSAMHSWYAQQLPLVFKANITGDKWVGEALLPWSYFPPNVDKMNSYAIHGSGEERTYEALYPIPKEEIVDGQKPNFHRLEYFQKFRLQSIMGEGWVQPESDLWKGKL